jgi:cell cycle checkpoint control protein RAD9A
VSHAGPLNTLISAVYSQPSRPMRLRYGDEGLTSEFILMTIGEQRGSSATTSMAGSRAGSKKPTPRQALEASSSSRLRADNSMPPPPRSVAPMVRESGRSRIGRPSPPPPQPSVEANALFFTEADDDRKWDPANDTEEEDEEVLGWDVSGDQVKSRL